MYFSQTVGFVKVKEIFQKIPNKWVLQLNHGRCLHASSCHHKVRSTWTISSYVDVLNLIVFQHLTKIVDSKTPVCLHYISSDNTRTLIVVITASVSHGFLVIDARKFHFYGINAYRLQKNVDNAPHPPHYGLL